MDAGRLEDCLRVARGLARRLCHRLPELDPDEVYGDCVPQVLLALGAYNEGAGASPTSWVYGKVEMYLRGRATRPWWRRRVARQRHEPVRPRPRPGFDQARFLAGLSPRARAAAELALRGAGKAALFRALKRFFRWEASEVAAVCREIVESLTWD